MYADANIPNGVVEYMRARLRWDVFFVLEHDDLRVIQTLFAKKSISEKIVPLAGGAFGLYSSYRGTAAALRGRCRARSR